MIIQEYTRVPAEVRLLGSLDFQQSQSHQENGSADGTTEEAWVYLWTDDLSKLEPEIWR